MVGSRLGYGRGIIPMLLPLLLMLPALCMPAVSFTTAGSVTVNHIAKWDGASWSALGSGVGGISDMSAPLRLICPGNLYAGGGIYNSRGR